MLERETGVDLPGTKHQVDSFIGCEIELKST